MKLIVGLGNPGRKYEGTRHNAGFMVAEQLIKQHAAPSPSRKFDGELSEFRVSDQRILVLCPHTFMNASGQSVRKALDFYKLDTEDLLVVCDDLNLPRGKIRLRRSGSAGGQKGLADVIRHLGSDQWCRLKIGIGRPPAQWQVIDYVLGRFDSAERDEIDDAVTRSCQAAVVWATEGATQAMTQFNAQPSPN
ncbi:MAG: aminoacyl-tRNA hydrolase [Planctomycetota bacterium]